MKKEKKISWLIYEEWISQLRGESCAAFRHNNHESIAVATTRVVRPRTK